MELIDGKYYIDGIDVLDLADRYGCPFYVYNTSKIKEQYERLTDAINYPNFKINYACKALTNISILKYFNKLGSNLDTVSIQEVRLGLKAGFEPERITYTPNCVGIEELEAAKEYGVNINIDNLSILEQYGTEFPGASVCVRINPHILAGGNSKISTGHIDSKFGISIHQVPHIKRIVNATHLEVEGLHMHTGSDILDSEVFLQGAEILLNVAMEFPNLKYIDFGSGFKVAYNDNDVATDIEDLGKAISERFKKFCKEYGSELELVFEPGKYLVSESGHFIVKTNVIKQTTSTVFAGIDSGLNHLIRPMFYDAFHKITNVSHTSGRQRIYTVVGYICETDTFGVNRKMHEVREGDILAFHNAGAYCMSMASNYNSRFRPAEVLIHEGKDYLIRKRETMEDIYRNQIEIDL